MGIGGDVARQDVAEGEAGREVRRGGETRAENIHENEGCERLNEGQTDLAAHDNHVIRSETIAKPMNKPLRLYDTFNNQRLWVSMGVSQTPNPRAGRCVAKYWTKLTCMHTHAHTQAHTYERTHARTHTRTHARSQKLTFQAFMVAFSFCACDQQLVAGYLSSIAAGVSKGCCHGHA